MFRNRATGEIRVSGETREVGRDNEEKVEFEKVIEIEDEIEIEVELRDEKKGMGSERGSVLSGGSESVEGYSFLGLLGEEGEDEREKKRREQRKRRVEEQVRVETRERGLKNTPGWKERSDKERNDPKLWVRREREDTGTGEKIVTEGPIVTPEGFDLGLDRRGERMNHAGRKNNMMGQGRNAIFPKERGERGEKKNWVASFTRAGCVSCRGEDGSPNHNGRGGGPIILIIGDEGIPSVCGYTKAGEESGCAWVFRKEFLGLDEVGEILRKLDTEKKGWDVDSKKRAHEFFIPNGSKILVGSYSQLRRDGVEKYVGDFNQMVREVFRVTGDVGIEVLPYVPVVMEDMDRRGRECITGLVDWIEWISRQKGRESIRELGKTGGIERGDERVDVAYVRQFASMKNRMWVAGLEGDWRGRGNRLDLEKGNRVEVELRMVEPPKGIGRLMRNEGHDTEVERVRRDFSTKMESRCLCKCNCKLHKKG
jgi:hypothetical protein